VPRHARDAAAQLRQHRRPRRERRRPRLARLLDQRAVRGGKLILKGILDPEDARLAVETGADAIIVSNHGGRQLDGARSSIAALPGIVDAVDGRIEVHMDGGIRSGQDVLKAVALGAKGVYIGRPFLYGLGAGGKAGVTRALEIIRRELDVTMALCGRRDIRKVDRSILDLPLPS
jgi:L-lactate dehydrogenase (cytochrome)